MDVGVGVAVGAGVGVGVAVRVTEGVAVGVGAGVSVAIGADTVVGLGRLRVTGEGAGSAEHPARSMAVSIMLAPRLRVIDFDIAVPVVVAVDSYGEMERTPAAA